MATQNAAFDAELLLLPLASKVCCGYNIAMAVEQVAQHSGARTWKWLKIDRARDGGTVKTVASGLPMSGRLNDFAAPCAASEKSGLLSNGLVKADSAHRNTKPPFAAVYAVPTGEERTIVILAGERVRVVAATRSVVHIVRLQTQSTSRAELDVTVDEDAKVTFAEVILPSGVLPTDGADGVIYSDFIVRLVGARSSFRSDVAYMAAKGYTADVCHIVHHGGRASRSVMRIAGSVSNGGDKVYRGTIDFHKGCGGSKGEETEEVLMLSPTAKNRSLPVILCDEEDVEGEHGTTIGRLDEATLFYVNSRGVSSTDAIGMICRAKLERVASLFQDETEKAKALQAIDEWFTRG